MFPEIGDCLGKIVFPSGTIPQSTALKLPWQGTKSIAGLLPQCPLALGQWAWAHIMGGKES